jgi:citrate lyase subunit beta/citryl-CoA lyase
LSQETAGTPHGGKRLLRRSLLFVPGTDPRKIEKAAGSGADALILDLEDAVAPGEKDRARDLAAAALREGRFGGSEAIVRINAPGTPFFEADIDAVAAAGGRAIMLPKAETAEGITRAAERLEGRLAADATHAVRLLALVESAAGIANVASLAGASPRVDALCFGHADFSRDMGLPETDASSGVILYARCTLVIAARAARVPPIDTVFLDVRDERGFRDDAALGLRLGFEGKLCIHPAQVKIVNDLLTPTAEEIARARRVIEAWEEARAAGRGVFALDGRMVDAPVAALAETVLERARRAGVIEERGEQE